MSRRQFEQVNTITEERTMDLLRRMDDAKKEFLFGLMKSAVLADGAVHAHEIEMLKDICHKAEIPTGR